MQGVFTMVFIADFSNISAAAQYVQLVVLMRLDHIKVIHILGSLLFWDIFICIIYISK